MRKLENLKAATAFLLIASLTFHCALASAQGISLLKDTDPEQSVYSTSTFSWLGQVGAHALFTHGSNLWSTDGTSSNTTFISGGVSRYRSYDLERGSTLRALDLYFYTQADDRFGVELYRTDGTASGTYRISDAAPGGVDAYPRDLTEFSSNVFFIASDRLTEGQTEYTAFSLWRTNGSVAGTTRVESFPSTVESVRVLGQVADGLVLSICERVKCYLAKSDGLAPVSTPFSSIHPGRYALGDDPWPVFRFKNRIYFHGSSSNLVGEFWSTDGTAEGTSLLVDSTSGPNSSELYGFIDGGEYFFILASGTSGEGIIWVSDGTPLGTRRVATLALNSSQDLQWAVPLANSLLLMVLSPQSDYSQERQLIKVDIVTGQSRILRSFSSPSFNFEPLAHAGSVYFSAATQATGQELWRTDGTEIGTTIVADLAHGEDGSDAQPLAIIGDSIYFAASSETYGREIWYLSTVDACPLDPMKNLAGFCGCGFAENDTDKDLAPDCSDQCPLDALKTTMGECGCGVADVDSNDNFILDCNDVDLESIELSAPRIKVSRKNLRIGFQDVAGVDYRLQVIYFDRNGKRLRKVVVRGLFGGDTTSRIPTAAVRAVVQYSVYFTSAPNTMSKPSRKSVLRLRK